MRRRVVQFLEHYLDINWLCVFICVFINKVSIYFFSNFHNIM